MRTGDAMLVQIGRKREATDLVGKLDECHDRIRRLVVLARRLGESDGGGEELIRETAVRLRDYFGRSFPLHQADEEASILPRLVGRDDDLDEALEQMRSEHDEHEAGIVELVSLVEELAVRPARHPELRVRLATVAAAAERALGAHLASEEQRLFPAIRRLLSPSEQAAIVAEMRSRRGG